MAKLMIHEVLAYDLPAAVSPDGFTMHLHCQRLTLLGSKFWPNERMAQSRMLLLCVDTLQA